MSAAGTSHVARNYAPLPITITEAEGAWVRDVEGRRYLDLLAGYSALNFGHRHPALVDAAVRQLRTLTLTSRAFKSVHLEEFCAELAQLCRKDLVLPMNTGAEAVETSLKVARKWAYQVKGIDRDRAKIVTMDGNFHGRTISIVSFSRDSTARTGFGPFTPGFPVAPFGDLQALEASIDDETAAVLLEPIQGEAGVIIPPDGYLRGVRDICDRKGVLMIADEIQSGLGRTGRTFACDHENVIPDVYVLGKALGGGILPLSAVVADQDVLGVIGPGEHGSTFGGNPLACAVGRAVLGLLRSGEPQQRAQDLGALFTERLNALPDSHVAEVRVRGLWAGVDLVDRAGSEFCRALATRGVLAKDTHGSTIRLAPPIPISADDLEWGLGQVAQTLAAR